MSDPPAWRELPVVAEFHKQWWRVRGRIVGASKLPFSRDWEKLLEDAGLTRAELRVEAERDARLLDQSGLWKIQSMPRRPHLPGRIRLPVDQELRLALLFDDPIGQDTEKFDASQFDWVPELAFLTEERSLVPVEDLLSINRFLHEGGGKRPLVPIKERSLELFGDEKRLDGLATTSLFRQGRLSLEMLQAYVVPEPLGWRRGPLPNGVVLVLENAATWDSFSRWNADARHYAAVIYGAGFRFPDGVPFLREIEREVGTVRRIDYFGDLDPEGLRIPALAAKRCRSLGLPVPLPLLWAYQLLIEVGKPVPMERALGAWEFLSWLGDSHADKVAELFESGQRIAQEWIGHERLFDRNHELEL